MTPRSTQSDAEAVQFDGDSGSLARPESDEIKRILGSATTARHLAQSTDGRLAASLVPSAEDADCDARLIVVDQSDEIHTVAVGVVQALAWSPSGRLAYATWNGTGSVVQTWAAPGSLDQCLDAPLDVSGVVEQLQWSPAGRLFALVASSGADASVGAGARAYAYAEGPIVRKPGSGSRGLVELALDDASTHRLLPSLANVWEFDVGAGEQIVAIVSDDASESGWYDSRIVRFCLDAVDTELVHESGVQLAVPRISPSGRRLAFVSGWASDRGYVAGVLSTLDLSGRAAPEALDLDVDVISIGWENEHSLWFFGWRDAQGLWGTIAFSDEDSPVVTVAPTAASAVALRAVCFPPVSSDGGIAPSFHGVTDGGISGSSIVRFGPSAVDWHPLLPLTNLPIENQQSVVTEPLQWASCDGLIIQGFLFRPSGSDRSLPAVVNVHGGPANLWTGAVDATVLLFVRAGYAVLRVNPRGSVGRGQAFSRANLGDPGGRELDDLRTGIAHCGSLGLVDPNRVAAIGGSYGGYLTSCLAVVPGLLRCAAVVSGHPDLTSARYGSNNSAFYDKLLLGPPTDQQVAELYSRRSPTLHVGSGAAPTLVLHGTSDRCTPVGQAEEFYRALMDAEIPTELVLYPGEGHRIAQLNNQLDYWTRVLEWFHNFLKPDTHE